MSDSTSVFLIGFGILLAIIYIIDSLLYHYSETSRKRKKHH